MIVICKKTKRMIICFIGNNRMERSDLCGDAWKMEYVLQYYYLGVLVGLEECI